MNVADFRTAASQNLQETYVRLASASPETSRWSLGPIEGCLGEFEHPICNFGITSHVPHSDLPAIREVASSKRSFHLYLLPGPEMDSGAETLRRGGFRELYPLVEMVGPSHAGDDATHWPVRRHLTSQIEPCLAIDSRRLEIGRFMTEQFFAKQPEPYKESIAQSTAVALELDLYAVYPNGLIHGKLSQPKGEPIAGVMLSRSGRCQQDAAPLQAGTLGIYNLCVDPMYQGTGIGSALVSWALQIAQREGRIATLQSDPRLAHWYQGQGFWKTGIVRAFGLDPQLNR